MLTHLLIYCGLVAIALTGDYYLNTVNDDLVRALIDNSTHGFIACLSWLDIVLRPIQLKPFVVSKLSEPLLCYIIACVIDVDHFLLAGSWDIKEAVNLGNTRPILHCTSLWIIGFTLVFILGQVHRNPRLIRLSWMLAVSSLSHHVRDASRRGLWLCPVGSTPPLPYYIYILIIILIPLAVYHAMQYFNNISWCEPRRTVEIV